MKRVASGAHVFATGNMGNEVQTLDFVRYQVSSVLQPQTQHQLRLQTHGVLLVALTVQNSHQLNRWILVMEQAVDRQVMVEQVADTEVVDTLVAALVAVVDRKSVHFAEHPYIAAPLISYLHDALLHRLHHLQQRSSGAVVFF